MGQWTVISANQTQINKLYNKHLFKGAVIKKTFSYDSEDSVGFVTLHTITGKKWQYQLRDGKPMFVEVTGFGNIRYDISYPEQHHKDLYNRLKDLGKIVSDDFWAAGEI
mgnify:CR=1 FL=1|tara:strand:+ start:2912 stop:3238 length:327 start_codon:yes stop_codon:yes gene_type:complete